MRRALLLVVAACHKDAPPPAPTTPVAITATTGAPEAFGSGGHATMRKGTLPLARPMQFALLGTDGVYDEQFQMIAFDLNRDGTLDTTSLDSDELIHNFEKHVAIDGVTYDLAIDHAGASLTLTPRTDTLPPRISLHKGVPAPDFTATTLEGEPVSLSKLRGKTVLLDFWSKSCTPCLRSMPMVEELPAKGFEVVSIADADGGDVAELVKGHPGHHVLDTGPVQSLYRIDRFPTYFLVGKDGAIACARCPLPEIMDTPP
jgi:thiol-disulfide isomerase/thioredoxin